MSAAEPDGGGGTDAEYEVYDAGEIDKDDFEEIDQIGGARIGISSSGSALEDVEWEEGAPGTLQAGYDDLEESDAKGYLHDLGGGEAEDEQVQFETMRRLREQDGLDVEIYVPQEQTEDLDIDAEPEETGVEVNRSWIENDDPFEDGQQESEKKSDVTRETSDVQEVIRSVDESGEKVTPEEFQEAAEGNDTPLVDAMKMASEVGIGLSGVIINGVNRLREDSTVHRASIREGEDNLVPGHIEPEQERLASRADHNRPVPTEQTQSSKEY